MKFVELFAKGRFVQLLRNAPQSIHISAVLNALFRTILTGDPVAENVFFLLQRQVCTCLEYRRKIPAQNPHGRVRIRWRKIIRLIEQEKA